MKNITDNELVARVKSDNCSDSLTELCRRHSGLITQMVQKYSNTQICSGLSAPDLIEHKLSIVYGAARNFEPARQVKFVTWLGNNARFFCLHAIKRESKYLTASPETTQYIFDTAVEKDNTAIQQECEYVLAMLDKLSDKRIEKIVKMRYFSENKSDRSFNAIGRALNMSAQGVHDLHDNFINFIRRKIQTQNNMDEI